MTKRTATAAKAEQPDLLANAPAQPAKSPASAAPKKKAATEKPTTAVAVIRRDQESLLAIAARAAADDKVDAGKMREIFEMQKEVRAEQARAAFNEDYMALQRALPTINRDGKIVIAPKDGKRGQTTPFSTFNNIMRVCRPILDQHRFVLSYATEPTADGTRIIVKGFLDHEGGHQRVTAFPLPAEPSGSKNNVQAWGSSFSYGKRYATIALLNIRSEDPKDADTDGITTPLRGPKQIDGEIVVEDAGPPKITQQQADKIVEGLEAAGKTRKQFCASWGIENVSDLRAENYDRAMGAISALLKGKR